MEDTLKERFESLVESNRPTSDEDVVNLMLQACQLAEGENNQWTITSKKEPEFGTYVWCYCPIYGRYIGKFINIGEVDGKLYGNWHNGNELGCLPPLLWMPINKPSLPAFCEDCQKIKVICNCDEPF